MTQQFILETYPHLEGDDIDDVYDAECLVFSVEHNYDESDLNHPIIVATHVKVENESTMKQFYLSKEDAVGLCAFLKEVYKL